MSSDIQIVYGDEVYLSSLQLALDQVCREKIYLEIIEAPSLEDVRKFQMSLFSKKAPVFYAVTGDRVVGCLDVVLRDNPRLAHRGWIGMFIIREFRGKGLGSRLMEKTIAYSREIGLSHLDLQVYTSNAAAIALYRKFGFQEVGVTRDFRRVDQWSFDTLNMTLTLATPESQGFQTHRG